MTGPRNITTWVSALLATGYRMYAVNPMAAARYRERHHVGGSKSDAADAKMLADLGRGDGHGLRRSSLLDG